MFNISHILTAHVINFGFFKLHIDKIYVEVIDIIKKN